MVSFSAGAIDTPSACSPSLSVVSQDFDERPGARRATGGRAGRRHLEEKAINTTLDRSSASKYAAARKLFKGDHACNAPRTSIMLAPVLLALLAAPAAAQDSAVSSGTGPSLQHMGPIAFGPDAVLFAADAESVQVYALDLAAHVGGGAPGASSIEAIDEQIAATLGTRSENLLITDLAVHPATRNVFISVMRGTGAGARPVLLRVDGAGDMTVVSLDQVPLLQRGAAGPARRADRHAAQERQRDPDSQLSQQPGGPSTR